MAKNKENKRKLGQSELNLALFVLGLVISIIGSIVGTIKTMSPTVNQIIVGLLIILGVIIGIINIKSKEVVSFLTASITFVLLGGPFLGLIGQTFIQSALLVNFFTYVVAFVVPAAIIVALKTIYLTAKDD